nr:bifunctional hydroxymethylpyrimidine kinase/phosphomethylpyrimidine kinase [Stutzerimonas kunmingensis]
MAVSIDFASASGPEPLPLDVISIQSQVVYGCVGNSIAVPVLNAGGLSVGAIPTVLLSNTPHYSTCHGGALPTSWFAGYLKDLEARDALRSVRTVLVGYLGSTTQAAVLARWLGTVLERYPDIRVQLDPVLGDDDCGMYVEPAMVSAFQTHLLRFAHGLTPNAFELARLSGRRVETVEQVIDAARSLLIGRTQWVVVTSAAQHEWPSERMYVVVVTKRVCRGDRARASQRIAQGHRRFLQCSSGRRIAAGVGAYPRRQVCLPPSH